MQKYNDYTSHQIGKFKYLGVHLCSMKLEEEEEVDYDEIEKLKKKQKQKKEDLLSKKDIIDIDKKKKDTTH